MLWRWPGRRLAVIVSEFDTDGARQTRQQGTHILKVRTTKGGDFDQDAARIEKDPHVVWPMTLRVASASPELSIRDLLR